MPSKTPQESLKLQVGKFEVSTFWVGRSGHEARRFLFRLQGILRRLLRNPNGVLENSNRSLQCLQWNTVPKLRQEQLSLENKLWDYMYTCTRARHRNPVFSKALRKLSDRPTYSLRKAFTYDHGRRRRLQRRRSFCTV